MTHRAFARADGTDADDRMIFAASTPGVKRDGIELRPEGWRTENFERNPVILWAHDYRSLPIGRGTVVDSDSGSLRIAVEFDQSDPFARTVQRKYRDGFLNAVSVGWDWVREDGSPIDFETWISNSDEDLARQLWYDLLETSAVPVPADADALLERRRSALADLRDLGVEPVRTPSQIEPSPEPEQHSSLEIARRRLALISRP